MVAASLREVADLPDRLLELRPSKNVGAVDDWSPKICKNISAEIKNKQSIKRSNTSKTTQLHPCSCYPAGIKINQLFNSLSSLASPFVRII